MTTAKMDDFNEYWTIEKARRRRLCWTKDNINLLFFPEIPEITICSNDISTKALVGYIRQAAEFNMEMTEYLKKAQAMYKKMRKRYFKRHATKILTSYSK